MKLRNSFRIPVSPEQAWPVLNDVPRVARCAPGAQLLEQRENGAYAGTIGVRLGPVALSFKGTFIYLERDDAARRVLAEASGEEAKARGTARAQVAFVLVADGAGSRVDVDTDLQLAGSIAQYGRGAALIQSTAQVLIDQFATNLARELTAAPPDAPEPVAAPVVDAPGVAPEAAAAPVAAAPPPPAPAPPAEARPISGFTLLWKGFLAWLRGLLGGR